MNRKLLLYLDKQMSESERLDFENELRADPNLQKEYDKMSALFAKVDELNTNKADLSSYFIESRARLHRQVSPPSKFMLKQLATRAAFAMTVIIAFVWGYYSMNITPPKEKDTSFFSNLSTEEALVLVNDVPPTPVRGDDLLIEAAKDSSTIDAALLDEVGITKSNSIAMIEDMRISTDELIGAMDSDEIEQIIQEAQVNL